MDLIIQAARSTSSVDTFTRDLPGGRGSPGRGEEEIEDEDQDEDEDEAIISDQGSSIKPPSYLTNPSL